MKRIAVAALTLAIALPLAAQEPPPPQDTEAGTEAEVETAAETEAAEVQVDTASQVETNTEVEVDTAAQGESPAETAVAVDADTTAAADAASQTEPAAGQMNAEMQAMMEAWQKASTPGPQHAQLAEHFVGSWDAQTSVWMDPSAPPMTSTGTEVTTAEFDGRHVVSEFKGSMMGQPFTGHAVTSYDNTTGRYLVNWIDSMSTGQFHAQGECDPASKSYTFTGEMPDMMQPGTSIPIRQVIRIEDADHHVMEWYETRDGQEVKTMVIEYTRADTTPSD